MTFRYIKFDRFVQFSDFQIIQLLFERARQHQQVHCSLLVEAKCDSFCNIKTKTSALKLSKNFLDFKRNGKMLCGATITKV